MGFKRSGVQVPSPIPTKNLYHWMQVFLFILHCLKKGLERVGIADTTAISVACLRQMMDTHRLPPRRDSVAEQVPSPIGLSYICVNASYIAFGSYICLWQVILLTLFAVVVRSNTHFACSLRSYKSTHFFEDGTRGAAAK